MNRKLSVIRIDEKRISLHNLDTFYKSIPSLDTV